MRFSTKEANKVSWSKTQVHQEGIKSVNLKEVKLAPHKAVLLAEAAADYGEVLVTELTEAGASAAE